MSDCEPKGWKRRDMLIGVGLFSVVAGLPLSACNPLKILANNEPTEAQRVLLRDVSQMVIPRTGTAGAGDIGVGDFVILGLAHGLENARDKLPDDAGAELSAHRRNDGSLDHISWLESELARRAKGDWSKLDEASRTAALVALDSDAYAEGVQSHPWRTIKALILTGYYTSKIGGSEELRFELVPGRYDPDVPVTAQTRSYSSDWTAVDFG